MAFFMLSAAPRIPELQALSGYFNSQFFTDFRQADSSVRIIRYQPVNTHPDKVHHIPGFIHRPGYDFHALMLNRLNQFTVYQPEIG